MAQLLGNAKEQLATMHDYMAKKGLKKTHQRDLVAKVLFSAPHKHFSIEEVLEVCRQKDATISYATVYRTLMMLSEAGFANQRQFGKGQSLFEVAAGEHHDHLICTECGKIVEFENDDIEALQDQVATKNGFRLTHHRMELYGLCPSCQ